MGKATIKDVCELSGLSLGTVSKYLNGGSLKEPNRKKVEEAIEKLGYQVDEYARGLITHRTKTVGVLLPELDNVFYARIVAKLEENLSQHGYATVVRDSRREKEKESEGIHWFIARRVDAIVIVPCMKDVKDYTYLQNVNIPIIFLDMWIKGLNFDYVIVNNREISKIGVNYLIERGHRDIAIMCAPEGVYTADRRLKGYHEAFSEHGLIPDKELCFRVEEDVDKTYETAKLILSKYKCTALFASNLPSLYGALFAISELRLNIPDEISLLGFDDMMFTKIMRPRLTIIDQPVDKIAEVTTVRILELLAQKDEGKIYTYRKNYLECGLKIGESILDLTAKR